jgi:hypothetical protein
MSETTVQYTSELTDKAWKPLDNFISKLYKSLLESSFRR